MTDQQERDSRAWKVVAELQQRHATPEQTFATLQSFADSPQHLHFTPHLVTALREASMLPVPVL